MSLRRRAWPLVLAVVACQPARGPEGVDRSRLRAPAGQVHPAREPERPAPPLPAFGLHAWCVTEGPRAIFCERRWIRAAHFDPDATAQSCTEVEEPVAELRVYGEVLLVRTASGGVLEGKVPSSSGAFPLRRMALPSAARAIGAGLTSCAATEADGVLCWGVEGPPTRVPGIGRDVRTLAVAAASACVLEGDGHVSCWGDVAGEWRDTPRRIFADARSLAMTTDGHAICAAIGPGRRLHCFVPLLPNRVDDLPPPELSYGVVDAGVEPAEQVVRLDDSSLCVVTSGALYSSGTSVDMDPLRTVAPGTRLLPVPPIGPVFERVRALDSEARVVSLGHGICVLERGETLCSTDPAGALERPRSCPSRAAQ